MILDEVKRKDQWGAKNNQYNHSVPNDEVKKLYSEGKSTIEIGKIYGVTDTCIRKRLKSMGIARRTSKETRAKVAEILHSKWAPKKSNKWNRYEYLKIAKANFKWVCIDCGKGETNANFDLIVHHKDRNNRNNAVDNLEVLCQQCHARKHRLEGW